MVIVVDKHKRPLGFMTERRCRIVMEKRRAVLYRMFPTVIIMKDVDAREIPDLPEYRIKIDPGSIHTGIAIVRIDTNEMVYAMQIEHRGSQIRANLETRSGARRNRRQRETWYRRPKWGNQCTGKNHASYDSNRKDGWLPPSVKSVGDNIISWVTKLRRWINITECSFEAVRFDMQKMEHPDIEGVEYQYGTLFGYEVREYLMETYGHTCQYCGGKSGDPVLEWEHKVPKSRGGSDSMKNATLACRCCNQDKSNRKLNEWLQVLKDRVSRESGKAKELDQTRIQMVEKVMEGKAPIKGLRYAAWVNSTRRYVEKGLFQIFDTVECSSGGRTKYNRTTLGYPKDHHYDALCVGKVPKNGYIDRTHGYYLDAKAMGRGSRLRGKINKCGIIVTKWYDRNKTVHGFQTGDIVCAEVPHRDKWPYKYEGRFVGRVMVRKTGSFDIRTVDNKRIAVRQEFCRLIQNNSGYQYVTQKTTAISLSH